MNHLLNKKYKVHQIPKHLSWNEYVVDTNINRKGRPKLPPIKYNY